MGKVSRKQEGRRIFLFAVLLFVFCFSFKSEAAVKSFDLKTTVTSKTRIKLSWKKKSVSGYDIYRAKVDKNGNVGAYKNIATISGKKTSYTDKVAYKKYYSYKVKGYRKKGGKKVYQYQGESEVYAGVAKTEWTEFFKSDAKVGTDSIELTAYSADGMAPTGYDIYRSIIKTETSPFGYKKIARVNTKGALTYEDKSVTAGVTYYYKVRAYKKLNGKTIYGEYSDTVRLSAVNGKGTFQIQSLTEDNQKVKNLTFAITSDANNADVIIDGDTNKVNSSIEYYCRKTEKEDGTSVYLLGTKYSYDNKTWYSFGDREIILKPGKTIYIMFEEESGKEFDFHADGMEIAEIDCISVVYNDLISYLDIDLKSKTAGTRVNGEYYH